MFKNYLEINYHKKIYMSLALVDLAYLGVKGVGYSVWYLFQGSRSAYYYMTGQESPEEIEAREKQLEKEQQEKREEDRIQTEQTLAKELALLRDEIKTLKSEQQPRESQPNGSSLKNDISRYDV